jgi:hypothetical protein
MNKKNTSKFNLKFHLLFIVLFILFIISDRFLINKPDNNLVMVEKDSEISFEVIKSDYNRGVLILNDSIMLESSDFINSVDYEGLLDISLFSLPIFVNKSRYSDTLIIKHSSKTDYLIFK